MINILIAIMIARNRDVVPRHSGVEAACTSVVTHIVWSTAPDTSCGVAKLPSSLLMLGALTLSLSCAKTDTPRVELEASPSASPSPVASPTPAKPSQAKQIDKRWLTTFTFATRSIKREHKGIRSYEISADYPQIKERTPRTLRFNRWIRAKVVGYVQEFTRLERGAEVRDRKRGLDPAPITEGLKIWFDMYYADERLVSLRITHSVMALGQTHPIDYYETINYDLRRGRELKHYDIFKRGYLKKVSTYCRTFVKENYQMNDPLDEWLIRGTEAKRSNFPNWNIVPDGILIAFEDYQIGPHSFGQLELIIPYSELKAVLRARTPTARFVKYRPETQ